MTRYQCYEIGLKNSWLTVDDIRKKENMLPVGMEFPSSWALMQYCMTQNPGKSTLRIPA